MKVVFFVKPLNLFLSESSTELLNGFQKSVKMLYSINDCSEPQDSSKIEASVKPTWSVDFIYISDIQLNCRTSSKSMLTPVKYLPSIQINLPFFMMEDVHEILEKDAIGAMERHYMVELQVMNLIKSNMKNLALIAQLFKAAHAVMGIYQYARNRNERVGENLSDLQEFFLWNLYKAGELGASVFNDVLNSLGNHKMTKAMEQ